MSWLNIGYRHSSLLQPLATTLIAYHLQVMRLVMRPGGGDTSVMSCARYPKHITHDPHRDIRGA